MKNKAFHRFIGLALLAVTASFSSNAAADSVIDEASVPPVNWFPCFDFLGPFECAFYPVPLDYSEVTEDFYEIGAPGAIEVVVIRLPATDQANKIGSLFLNPGGPGGSGVNFVLGIGGVLYTPEVRAKFDIVSFDPRGTNRSAALSCFTSFDHLDDFFALPAYPETIEEIDAQIAFDDNFRQKCAENALPILDNMSTADVARDMEILRLAVGDYDGLNYAGYSYGSFLGVTYANMFPNSVRALIVDAVLDPIAWTTGRPGNRNLPFSTRLLSAKGAQDTLQEFFRLCEVAGTPRCAFSSPDVEARYDALLDRLAVDPITLIFPDGSTLFIDNVELTAITLNVLYNPFNWIFYANDLAFLESIPTTTASSTQFSVLGRAAGLNEEPLVPQTIEAFPGVGCIDSDNPSNPLVWAIAGLISEFVYGDFGRLWTWASSPCAGWPADKSSRYAGPFTRNTSNPVLVTSTVYDPATRYGGALIVSDLLPNSQLLSVGGWGHTTLFLSECATQAASDYLVNQTLPSTPFCLQDFPPFNLTQEEAFGGAVAERGPGTESANLARESAAADRDRAMREIQGARPTYGDR